MGPRRDRRTRLPPSVGQGQGHPRPGHGKDQHCLGVHHLLGKAQDIGDGITGLALAGRQRVTVSSGQFFLPAAARCQECSQEAACCRSFPQNSLRAPLFLLTQPCCPQPVMGRWLLRPRPSVRKCSPLSSSPSGTRGPGPGPGGGVECGASQEDKRAFTRALWLRAGSRNEQGPRWTGRARCLGGSKNCRIRP